MNFSFLTRLFLILFICLNLPLAAYSAEEFTDIVDIKLDFKSMKGKKVKIRGFGIIVGDHLLMSKSKYDQNKVEVILSDIHRDQRKQVLLQCTNWANFCNVAITGTVSGAAGIYPSLIAEQIIF